MNYDQPRELADKSGWHYTTGNRRTGIHAIGYCADHEPHATEAEARECYGQYLRDNVRMDEPHSWSWGSCEYGGARRYRREEPACKNPANNGAHSGSWNMVLLCDEHFTVEHAIVALGLAGPAGNSIHS